MKQSAFLFFLSFAINVATAQVTFQKTYGTSSDEFKSYAVATADGGYAIAGSTQGAGAGGYDVYLIRTDNVGNILWTRTYGGPNTDIASNIHQTSDGGFIIVGATLSFGAGGYDTYLIRTDMNGDTLWTKTYGAATNENGWDVQQTEDGGFMILSNWASTSSISMIKTNSQGDLRWTKIYLAGNPSSVMQTSNKGYVVCGSANFLQHSTSIDAVLFQTDSLGNMLWFKTYGGPVSEYVFKVINANDGGYIMVGLTGSFGAGNEDIYVVKTDSIGQMVWSKTYGNADFDEGADIVSTGTSYTLLGRTAFSPANNYWTGDLINIDNNGNINWAKNYFSNGSAPLSLQKANDGGYVFSGILSDFYLTKTDSLGNSGCNDSSNHSIIVSTPATIVDTIQPGTIEGTIVGSTQTKIGSGGTSTTICLSTGIENVPPAANAFLVYPNPCTDCAINGITNTNDLIVTDIMGQNVSVTFSELPQGCIVHFPPSASGIYFVRNVKTGEVSKLIKQ